MSLNLKKNKAENKSTKPTKHKHDKNTFQNQATLFRFQFSSFYLWKIFLLMSNFFPSREQRICPLNPEYLCWISRSHLLTKMVFHHLSTVRGFLLAFFCLLSDSYNFPAPSFAKERQQSYCRAHLGQVWGVQGTAWTTSCILNRDPKLFHLF